MKRYIYQRKEILMDRYEFLIYRLLRNRLEAGDVFCRNSIRFRSFEDDLINDHQWQQKETLITDTGLTNFNKSIHIHLAELEKKLEDRIAEVNENISSGKNESLEIKKRGQHTRWTLPNTRYAESINHSFYDTLKQIDIRSVLHFVNS